MKINSVLQVVKKKLAPRAARKWMGPALSAALQTACNALKELALIAYLASTSTLTTYVLPVVLLAKPA